MNKKELIILVIIFLIVLGTRLLFAFSTDNFTVDSYFSIRQAESIQETGYPAYNDELSSGGRDYFFPPLFQYILALFGFIITIPLAAKLLPNILFALLVPITYFISLRLTNNSRASLISAVLVGFLPAIIGTTYTVDSTSLFIPLFFGVIYGFLKLDQKNIQLVLILIVLLVLTSPISIVLVIALLTYLLLSKLEGFSPNKKEMELSLFLTFLALWSGMILYKNSLFSHGLAIFGQNTPKLLAQNIFAQITFVESFLLMGILILALGLYGGYVVFSDKKSKQNLLIISVMVIFFIALLLQLIPLILGVMFLGISLAILSSIGSIKLNDTLTKLKFKYAKYFAYFGFIIFFIALSILPSLLQANNKSNILNNDELDVLNWINENTEIYSTILASVELGHPISSIAKRKNVMDMNFLGILLVDQKYEDIKTIYTSPFQTESVPLIRYYNVNYIIVSPREEAIFGEINFEDNCFKEVYSKKIKVIEFDCDG